jgi:hypothetical protein
LVCWGIFLGNVVGCAAGDGESEKRREAGRCWVCCGRSKRRKCEEEREMIIKKIKLIENNNLN